MTLVLRDLLADFGRAKLNKDSPLQANKQDPALRELMLDTRSFLSNEH